jgi:outer membrane immunogenic protein
MRMPVKAPMMAAAYNWTGFYLGVHAGYGWGNADSNTTHLPSQTTFNASPFGQSTNADGFIGGAQAGYNWQTGAFVFGVEADISFSGMRGSSRREPLTANNGVIILTSFQDVTTDMDWFGTARLRAGFTVAPQLLLYATGGLAFGQVDDTVFTTYIAGFPAASYPGSSSDTRVGWTLGGGAEWALTQNWTVKAEYLYFDLGDATITANPAVANPPFQIRSNHDLTGSIARLGVNYKF